MNTQSTQTNILVDVLFPIKENAVLRNLFLVITGSLVLWASAKVKIPFYPVPMTMTTFVVLVIGMVYGWKLGAATILLYIAEGAIGLPVFAGTPEKGVGLAYIMGPTGGYLAGYVLAAAICGYLAQLNWDKRVSTTALAMLLGNLAIYVPGLLWLGMLFGWDKPILAWGLIPFIAGDLAKIALAAATIPLIWKIKKSA